MISRTGIKDHRMSLAKYQFNSIQFNNCLFLNGLVLGGGLVAMKITSPSSKLTRLLPDSNNSRKNCSRSTRVTRLNRDLALPLWSLVPTWTCYGKHHAWYYLLIAQSLLFLCYTIHTYVWTISPCEWHNDINSLQPSQVLCIFVQTPLCLLFIVTRSNQSTNPDISSSHRQGYFAPKTPAGPLFFKLN